MYLQTVENNLPSPSVAATSIMDASVTTMSKVTDLDLRIKEAEEKKSADRINIGQHSTLNMLTLAVNRAQYEQCYDSDDQLESFYDAVRGGEGESFFEEAIGRVLMENIMPTGGVPSIPKDTRKNSESGP